MGGYWYEVDGAKNYWERGLFMGQKTLQAIKGSWIQKVPKHLKERGVKRNKRFYEGGRWK